MEYFFLQPRVSLLPQHPDWTPGSQCFLLPPDCLLPGGSLDECCWNDQEFFIMGTLLLILYTVCTVMARRHSLVWRVHLSSHHSQEWSRRVFWIQICNGFAESIHCKDKFALFQCLLTISYNKGVLVFLVLVCKKKTVKRVASRISRNTSRLSRSSTYNTR